MVETTAPVAKKAQHRVAETTAPVLFCDGAAISYGRDQPPAAARSRQRGCCLWAPVPGPTIDTRREAGQEPSVKKTGMNLAAEMHPCHQRLCRLFVALDDEVGRPRDVLTE